MISWGEFIPLMLAGVIIAGASAVVGAYAASRFLNHMERNEP